MMIKADVLVDNIFWKKSISKPNIYLKNRLKKDIELYRNLAKGSIISNGISSHH